MRRIVTRVLWVGLAAIVLLAVTLAIANAILEDAGAANVQWAMSASPLIVGDVVIVLPGGGNGRSVVAYDRRSGKRAWSALDDGAAYSAPMLATISGVEQILAFTATRLLGLSTDGGRLLWEYAWPTQGGINAAQPIVIDHERVFLSAGYGMGAALLRLTRAGDQFTVEEVWRSPRMKNQFTSSVYHDGYIYGLDESDPRLHRRRDRPARPEGRPVWLRPAPARVRASDRDH